MLLSNTCSRWRYVGEVQSYLLAYEEGFFVSTKIPSRWGQQLSEPTPPTPAPKANGKVKKVKAKAGKPQTELALRIARIVGRREETTWSVEEVTTFFRLQSEGCFEDLPGLDAVERYYAGQRKRGREGFHRRTLLTFLKYYRGEVDKAHNDAKPVRARPPVVQKQAKDGAGATIAVESDPTAEAGFTTVADEIKKLDFAGLKKTLKGPRTE